jgi:hypothetical protein
VGRHRRSETDVLRAAGQYAHLVNVLHAHCPGDRAGLCMACGTAWPCLEVRLTLWPYCSEPD